MTQISNTASTCEAKWKMWLIKLLSVIYFTAICAAQDPQGDSSVPTLLRSSWSDVFPSETVELSCGINRSSDWSITWYRDDAQVQDTDPNVDISSDESVLKIKAATHMYAGSYVCEGHHKSENATFSSDPFNVSVYANKPKLTVSRRPNFDKMFPGESVTFTCMVDTSSGWEYLWYHNGTEIQARNNNDYTIESIDLSNSGEYHCKAKRGKGPFYTEESKTILLLVSDPPVPNLKQLSPWLDLFEEEDVSFSCEVDGSDWTYTWYKDQGHLGEDQPFLNISFVTKSDEGDYACQVHLKPRGVSSGLSNTANIRVYESLPEPTVSKSPDFNPMYVGERVTFTCNVNLSSGWHFQWYKDEKHLPSATSETFSIPLSLSDGGSYSCKASRSEMAFFINSTEIRQDILEIPVPSLKQMTPWLDVFPSESVKLSCGMQMQKSSDWTYTWYKDGQKIQADNTVSFDSNGTTLSISSASVKHAGQYHCKGHLQDRSVSSNSSSELTLTVYDKKPSVTLTQYPQYNVMFSGETVSLRCHINVSSGWKYLWYKDGIEFGVSGNEYSINSVGKLNGGSYTCKVKRGTNQLFGDSSQVMHLEVKEIPTPSLRLMTPWSDIFPSESVNFSCGIQNSSDWTYTWCKDGEEVKAGNTVTFDPDGATLSISSASLSHHGNYSCLGIFKSRSFKSHLSSELTLSVYDTKPRVTLIQNPKYDVMHTKDEVSLSCHINVSSGWEYLWYKDGTDLTKSGNNLNISSAERKNTGVYTCQVKRGKGKAFKSDQSRAVKLDIRERPKAHIELLTGWSEVFSTDSLVLKCVVQESQDKWNYTWFKETVEVNMLPSERHTVTPQDDPEQSLYTCRGIRSGRPSYSKLSNVFATKNLLLKRRVLLSISGCLLFGLSAVLLGCFVLRFMHKPDDERPEEDNLFLTMAQLKNRNDAPCPLVDYITDGALNGSPTEAEENGIICSETTPLSITTEENQAVTTENNDAEENDGGLVSFKQ